MFEKLLFCVVIVLVSISLIESIPIQSCPVQDPFSDIPISFIEALETTKSHSKRDAEETSPAVSITKQLNQLILNKILSNPELKQVIEKTVNDNNETKTDKDKEAKVVNNYFIVPPEFIKVNETIENLQNLPERMRNSGVQNLQIFPNLTSDFNINNNAQELSNNVQKKRKSKSKKKRKNASSSDVENRKRKRKNRKKKHKNRERDGDESDKKQRRKKKSRNRSETIKSKDKSCTETPISQGEISKQTDHSEDKINAPKTVKIQTNDEEQIESNDQSICQKQSTDTEIAPAGKEPNSKDNQCLASCTDEIDPIVNDENLDSKNTQADCSSKQIERDVCAKDSICTDDNVIPLVKNKKKQRRKEGRTQRNRNRPKYRRISSRDAEIIKSIQRRYPGVPEEVVHHMLQHLKQEIQKQPHRLSNSNYYGNSPYPYNYNRYFGSQNRPRHRTSSKKNNSKRKSSPRTNEKHDRIESKVDKTLTLTNDTLTIDKNESIEEVKVEEIAFDAKYNETANNREDKEIEKKDQVDENNTAKEEQKKDTEQDKVDKTLTETDDFKVVELIAEFMEDESQDNKTDELLPNITTTELPVVNQKIRTVEEEVTNVENLNVTEKILPLEVSLVENNTTVQKKDSQENVTSFEDTEEKPETFEHQTQNYEMPELGKEDVLDPMNENYVIEDYYPDFSDQVLDKYAYTTDKNDEMEELNRDRRKFETSYSSKILDQMLDKDVDIFDDEVTDQESSSKELDEFHSRTDDEKNNEDGKPREDIYTLMLETPDFETKKINPDSKPEIEEYIFYSPYFDDSVDFEDIDASMDKTSTYSHAKTPEFNTRIKPSNEIPRFKISKKFEVGDIETVHANSKVTKYGVGADVSEEDEVPDIPDDEKEDLENDASEHLEVVLAQSLRYPQEFYE